jgi:predicted aldo/keto reductase-like oxidoreductase
MTHQDVLKINAPYAALGFGLMRLPDLKETVQMVDMYLEAGFNYFDTAYVYGGSEEKLREALVKRHPRESFLAADKIPPWMANSRAACDKLLHESLKRCGLDYFDFYLVHSLDADNEKKAVNGGVYEWIAEQKKKGTAKHIGFSFHGSTELLEHIFKVHPEMEFVQLQLNYVDVLRGNAGELHEAAQKHKKPVIVMEPVKGGTLASLPPTAEAVLKTNKPDSSAASWAIRYAGSLPGVSCLLSGMSTVDQMKDNIKTYNPFAPMSENELRVIEDVLQELSKAALIPCTSCKYCMADCPQNIEIPVCFNLYNENKRGASKWNIDNLYNSIPQGQRAGDCTACGSCIPRCPQQIDIPKLLETVARQFE